MGENKTKNMDSTYFGRQRTILKAFFFYIVCIKKLLCM